MNARNAAPQSLERTGVAGRIVPALLAIQLLLAAVMLGRSLLDRESTVEFVRPPEFERVAKPITIESGIPLADAYAAQWSEESRLIAMTLRLDWSGEGAALPATELPDRGWIIYLYANESETLSLYLDRGTGALIGNVVTGFSGSAWSGFDQATYPRRSEIAALTANITSGQAYQAACKEYRDVSLVTASFLPAANPATGAGEPAWVVTYGDSRYEGTFDVRFRLDATSGEVVTNDVRGRPCTA